VALERVDGALGRGDVEGDLGGMDFQGEADAEFLVGVEDRGPAAGEVGVAFLDHGVGDGGEGVEEVPDGAAGEAVDDLDAELGGGLAGGDHLGGGALADALGLAVAPDGGGEDRLVALVDEIGDGLADEVVGDGVDLEAVLFEEGLFLGAVVGLGVGAGHLEVVAPAGELKAVIAEGGGLGGEGFEGEIGPLAGEEGDGAGHNGSYG